MRILKIIGIVGVVLSLLSVTAVAEPEDSLTIEERKTQYETLAADDEYRGELHVVSRGILRDLNAAGRYEEAVRWGEDVYQSNPHASVAIGVLSAKLSAGDDDLVATGQRLYQTTPHGHLAKMVVDALRQSDHLAEAERWGKEAYGTTPHGSLADSIARSLLSAGRIEDGITWAIDAYKTTPDNQLAARIIGPMINAGRSDELGTVLTELYLSGHTNRVATTLPDYVDTVGTELATQYAENAPEVLLTALSDGKVSISGKDFVTLVEAGDTADAASIVGASGSVDDPEPAFQVAIRANLDAIYEEYPDSVVFQERMRAEVTPLLRRCSEAYQADIYNELLAELPLDGSFSDWEDVLRRYNWRLDQLSNTR